MHTLVPAEMAAAGEKLLLRRRSHPGGTASLDGGKEVFNDEKVVLVMVGLPARYVIRLHSALRANFN